MIRLVSPGRRDELATLSANGLESPWQRRTLGVAGRWPAVRNDGRRLWTCATQVSRRGATSHLAVFDLADEPLDSGLDATQVFEAEFPGGIAPRVPVYVNPSPVGDVAALVAPGDNGLRLEIVQQVHTETGGGLEWERRDCGPGGPIFPAWSPDGASLAVHRGIVLELLDRSGEVRDRLEGPTAFRTPAWSPDGQRIAFATVRDEAAVELRVATAGQLQSGEVVAELGAALVLGWQPGTEWLSVATAGDAAASSFTSLLAINTVTGEQRRLYGGPFVGFWWAPDGSRVIVMVPTQRGDGSSRLVAVQPGGTVSATSDAFVPSDDTRLSVAFFDQYAISHSPWLPDSSAFLVSGRLLGDGRPASFGDVAPNRVFIWEAVRGAPLTDAGPGDFATAIL